MGLQTSVKTLFGVGEKFASLFEKKLGIKTVGDLLNHFPQRYEDYSRVKPFFDVKNGEIVTVMGKITDVKNVYTSRINIQKIVLTPLIPPDRGEEGGLTAELTFFNQPFLLQSLKKDLIVSVSGVAERFGQKLQFKSPEWEIMKNNIFVETQQAASIGKEFPVRSDLKNRAQISHQGETLHATSLQKIAQYLVHTGRLIPIYPETNGISSKRLRALIFPLLTPLQFPLNRGEGGLIQEYLPDNIRQEENLIDLVSAYKNVHYPKSNEMLAKANFRLAFDELLLTQLQSLERKNKWKSEKGIPLKVIEHKKSIEQFISSLPFTLTNSQNRAIEQIFSDLGESKPMNRLLEGDVGSGKTVVAATAMYLVYLNGYSSALMCPTEILSNQHYTTINNLLSTYKVPIFLVTSSANHVLNSKHEIRNSKQIQNSNDQNSKQSIRGYPPEIRENPKAGIYIGTHALLEEKISIPNLNLVVIDEQHRFGVEQRGKLVKKGSAPHILTMTATPIPRTIALTFYGDLELSVLSEMPQKKKIKTWVVPHEKRLNAYEWIQKQILENGSQAFIICPFISPSETMETVKSAIQEFENLKNIFTRLKLELLTGKTKPKEKDQIMKSFANGEFDILVATPVVEVGIDIAGASIILIEGAERFGLAQLHQLRGRVGRRGQQAYCLLFTTEYNPESTRRLKALETVNNGLKLAEIDLKIRGMGNIFGTEQHGMVEFKKADISDLYMVEKTKNAAARIFEHLNDFPVLKKRLESGKIENIVNN